MPLPNKGEKETKQEFISRCMSDEKVVKEFPDNKQRYAVCIRQSGKTSAMEEADLVYNYETYGYVEEISEHNFYIPEESEYEDFGEATEEWDCAKEKPGLWENIRKKKEREGKKYKPAKRGDPDRPDPEAWKQAQSEEGSMAKGQLKKIAMQASHLYSMLGEDDEMEAWVQDKLSKAEHFVEAVYDYLMFSEPEKEEEEGIYKLKSSEYQGRKVTLNKPFRTPKGPKKFSVYVKNQKGNVVKVNFGSPDMDIKRDDPARRKSFRARHKCDTAKDKTTPRYWSCRQWRASSPVED
jgi:phage anti-repressor protein